MLRMRAHSDRVRPRRMNARHLVDDLSIFRLSSPIRNFGDSSKSESFSGNVSYLNGDALADTSAAENEDFTTL